MIRTAYKVVWVSWLAFLLSFFLPRSIDLLWEPWWNVETPGRAVCVLQYCSGLIYFEGENNPAFDPWTPDKGGGGPYLRANDCFGSGHEWMQPNIEFLQYTLSFDYILRKVEQAADRLANEPERDVARKIAADTRLRAFHSRRQFTCAIA